MKRSLLFILLCFAVASLLPSGNKAVASETRLPGKGMGQGLMRTFLRPHLSPLELEPQTLAIDTHVHTEFSHDSKAKVEDVLASAIRRGLSAIAITDHNTMDGYHRAEAILAQWKQEGKAPPAFFLIPGEEITTPQGHIVALYVTSRVSPDGTAEATIDAIHAQGGLAIAAHPMFRDSLGNLAKTLPFDGIERENGAEETLFAVARDSSRARREAFYQDIHGMQLGGSDAHDARWVGLCYTLLPDCPDTLEGVRAALEGGRTAPSPSPSFGGHLHHLKRGVSHLQWGRISEQQNGWQSTPMLRFSKVRMSFVTGGGRGFQAVFQHRF